MHIYHVINFIICIFSSKTKIRQVLPRPHRCSKISGFLEPMSVSTKGTGLTRPVGASKQRGQAKIQIYNH